jgi:hypothetical protein
MLRVSIVCIAVLTGCKVIPVFIYIESINMMSDISVGGFTNIWK